MLNFLKRLFAARRREETLPVQPYEAAMPLQVSQEDEQAVAAEEPVPRELVDEAAYIRANGY